MKQSRKTSRASRHELQCSICSHAERGEIEREFTSWASPNRIAKAHKVSRDAVYRHAHALGLFEKRRTNVRAALERIIECSGDVKVNAAAVVAAVGAYARINARGEWVERRESIDMNALFARMTRDELDWYARTGKLPEWFPADAAATDTEGQ
jgi:hypothetical protein